MSQPPSTTSTLLRAYLEADYRWELDGQWRHLHIGLPAPAVEAAFPDVTQFGLLSAWNPRSVQRATSENRAADDALHVWLSQSGLAFRPAFCSARDRTWREPSWLVMAISLPVFDTLAQRFGQLGALWWQRGEPVRLRMHAARPADCSDDPSVDWLK